VRVVFSQSATTDLEQIGDYIASDNPPRARTFVAERRAAALSLGEMPYAFRLLFRVERFGIRRRPVGKYLILYRIDQDRVAIVRILHGARDYEGLLFSEP
jgi:plasmid stabilization system protein ParE